jgi:hypothetical protein
MSQISQISRICPVTDAEAERMVRPATLADLADLITATQGLPAGRVTHSRGPARRRGWLIGTPLAAGLAAAVLVVTGLIPVGLHASGHRTGPAASPESTRPISAQALSFVTSDGSVTVIVRDPLADPARYRAEFAAHHLNITLKLVPASPSLVGTVVYIGEPSGAGITPITARGKCYTGGGGSACPVGVRIPADFRGQAELVFGRAARPGEQYESTAPATAPGEVMHGLRFRGLTVTQVLAMLRERDVTVPVFNYDKQGYARNLSHVPGTWYVYDATPWASQQVMLMVGPTRTPAVDQAPQPGTPVASPTRAAG